MVLGSRTAYGDTLTARPLQASIWRPQCVRTGKALAAESFSQIGVDRVERYRNEKKEKTQMDKSKIARPAEDESKQDDKTKLLKHLHNESHIK